ncbi:MAG: hypothetical protein E6Q40_04510 [Cupriavidus sp.]|nr:MAG: hypothetical protein E6Q40_04510 [Cupriavidus sp.]
MTGVDIVGALLRARGALTAMVPIERIKAGALPEGIALPALLLRSISTVERQRLKRGATIRVTERVSVTVRAASYRDQVVVMAQVLPIAGWTGDMAPARRISILSAGKGPDIRGPGNSFEQGQDFRVSYDLPA